MIQRVDTALSDRVDKAAKNVTDLASGFASVKEATLQLQHALEHHAEELDFKATKFDTAALSAKVDRCAAQGELETHLNDLQDRITYSEQKLADVGILQKSL